MLSPEAAEKRLKEFRGLSSPKARLLALPEPQRVLGFRLLGLADDGKNPRDWQKAQEAQKAAGETVHGLPVEERLTLFRALLPQLAEHVEAGWQLHDRLPYVTGYERRAFRAPQHPEISVPQRTEWLAQLVAHVSDYDQDIVWLAAWAPYAAPYYAGPVGILLAAAIERGGAEGEAVYETLTASARGEHEIGAMGRHVTSALLAASRPEGWEFVERLLLAAQRQEGLRQAILESVDETHPEAFRRMLRLILEHDLLRFSSVIRAVDVWFGFGLEADTAASAKATLRQVLEYLESPEARAAGLQSGRVKDRYLSLWATAFADAHAALEPAAEQLRTGNAEQRFVAAYLLTQLQLPAARALLVPLLDDEDLRVALTASRGALGGTDEDDDEEAVAASGTFEALERLVQRLPDKPKELPQIAWPWMTVTANRTDAAGWLVNALGNRSPECLLPYVPMMEQYTRSRVVDLLAKQKKPTPATRAALLTLAGDPAEWVRTRAFAALEKVKIQEPEAIRLEGLLSRKAADLRQNLLTVLLKQPDPQVVSSADRLLAAKSAPQRLGGLELLHQLHKTERATAECRERALAYQEKRGKLSEEEAQLLSAFLASERETPILDNALGLLNPAERTSPTPPRDLEKEPRPGAQPIAIRSEASLELVRSLDTLVHKQRETEIRIRIWDGSENTELLGNVTWGFPEPAAGTPVAEDAARLPLRELWEAWWSNRDDRLRDPDGFELLRAIVSLTAMKGSNPKYSGIVPELLHWLLRLHPPQGGVDFLLDAGETSLAQIPTGVLTKLPKEDEPWDLGWRSDPKRIGWLTLARAHRTLFPEEWSAAHHARLWGVARWIDEPGFGQPRARPELDDALLAFEAGAATEADLYDLFLGARSDRGYYGVMFEDLHDASARKPPTRLAHSPALLEIIDRCRTRIVEVETQRGDLPTAASRAALSLRYAGGIEILVRLLEAFGKGSLTRGYSGGDVNRGAVFSHLIRATFPDEQLTPQRFAERLMGSKVPEKRLIEVAFYAPQWATYVEAALGWPGLAEAVWWIHAHTKDQQWSVEQEIRDAWTSQVSERTPLSAESLVDGAVDVAWFRRVYDELGPERWGAALDQGAKYASGGGGHKRAQLFADAMLGRADGAKLRQQVEEKRNQDALRALGLLPLPEGTAGRSELLERYQIVQEFVRGSKQFGSQRQASEKLAAAISLENLARTAGYADPIRLEWAMEARAVEDLAAGPVSATAGEVTVTLSINDWGAPELSVAKSGKPLKAIPPAVKKDPAIAVLVERRQAVERQGSRMRTSLENAMCRGDRFTGTELRELYAHPALAPMLRNLVFIGEGSCGYPTDGGAVLSGLDERTTPVSETALLAIAHPYDLYRTGEWDRWQQDCFRRERIQPFKQVFRELYVLTPGEQDEGHGSRRYAGHQLNGKQAMALLGKRGWVTSPEDGDVRRTFHDCGLSAWVSFDYGITTPAEVEGLTIETVGFSRRGEWKPLPLREVPPRVFSEVMRDLDLVVSVAHQGGVDPETTASTVEMRAALLRETCELLRLENVRLQERHAVIEGKLGTYSVHLGSATVHRQPGGHLCIVPVHSQHRGRLFLPFLDPDPKTAEVVSKVLLLSRDSEIQDPTILEQIFASK
jgi:hypothetical protein